MVSPGGRPNPRALLCLCGFKKQAAVAHDEQLSDLDLEANEWCMQGDHPLSGGWERSLGGGLAAGASCCSLMTVSV